jgi:crotonobetainyl-CoA:carnitine CoA-transferase CaiB-like acyl-CoA transferase
MGTGLIAANAILAALLEHTRSGEGQSIEVPLYDSAISLTHPQAANTLMSGKVPVSTGNGHPNIVPYDTYDTSTCQLFLAIGNNGQFEKLCQLLEMPQVLADPRFADNAVRMEHRAEITRVLAERLITEDANELETRLMNAGIPAGAVRTVTDAMAHPHTKFRNMVVEKDGYKGIGIPAKLNRTPGSVTSRPPAFSEHCDAILREGGYSNEEIQNIKDTGVVIGQG